MHGVMREIPPTVFPVVRCMHLDLITYVRLRTVEGVPQAIEWALSHLGDESKQQMPHHTGNITSLNTRGDGS
jgi:hypothetical protein